MYPDGEVYDKLYASYIDGRQPAELIELAGDVKDKVVWDLCCGAGRLAKECVQRGAKRVFAVDVSSEMVKDMVLAGALEKKGVLRLSIEDVQRWLGDTWAASVLPDFDVLVGGPPWQTPDYVFCRQAVNYWLNEESARSLAEEMKPDSVFVFNTFHSKPMRKPKTKEYVYDDRWFVEVSWLVGETVHHIQVRDGMEAHHTSFRYISPKEYERILGPYFAIGVERKGNTSLYRCVRRAK